jgi:hypothetical protein
VPSIIPLSRIPDNKLVELQRETDLFKAVRRDLSAVGLVGESDTGLMVYHVYSSRLLERPSSVIVRGPSSGGKSTLLNKVAQLIPPMSKIEAMQMTDAAWFNTAEDHFVHKLFLGGERKLKDDDAARDATLFLRQLLSEGRISRGKSVSLGPCQWATEFFHREGPVAYAETTTAKSVFEEDLSRMIQLWIDESQEQTKAIVVSIAKRYMGGDNPDPTGVIDKHHEFQDWLQRQEYHGVCIPYAEALAGLLPTGKVQARRVVPQLFTILETTVLLNQHQRQLSSDGRLVATGSDYAEARKLLMEPFREGLGVGKDQAEAIELRKKVPGPRFILKDVEAAKGITREGARRTMERLRVAGQARIVSAGFAKTPAVYEWSVEEAVENVGLPEWREVAKAQRCQKG